MQANSLHAAALRWAAKGGLVFPLQIDGKKPLKDSNGFHDATTDTQQINIWWAEEAYNIGLVPDSVGLCVVDIDGDEGEASWARVCEEQGGAPETMEVRTPRGGRHLYFTGRLPPTVSRIGVHIDTRGIGSYVAVAPSTVNGSPYAPINNLAPAPLPWWLPGLCESKEEKREANVDVLDLPHNVSRAVTWLKGRTEVTQGDNADLKTYETACWLHNLGLSAEKTLEVMLEHYKCSPQDERYPAFLERKVENAFRYAQNEEGAWAETSTAEAFGGVLQNLGILNTSSEDVDTGDTPRFKLYSLQEMRSRPPIPYLMPDLLRERGMAMLYGAPETFKSFVTLDMCLTLASGIAGWGREASAPLEVVYVAAESPEALAQDRANAWQQFHQVSDEDLRTFHMVDEVPHAADPAEVIEMLESIRLAGVRPAVIVIDTLFWFMAGLSENDAKDASRAFEALKAISVKMQCLVVTVHHTGKDEKGPRGSSSFHGGFDTMLEVTRDPCHDVLDLHVRKQKDGAKRLNPITMLAKDFAGSKVLQVADVEMVQRTRDAGKLIDPAGIGVILAHLSAPVSAHVIAMELAPVFATETPEEHAARVDEIARAIEKASSTTLKAFRKEGKLFGV